MKTGIAYKVLRKFEKGATGIPEFKNKKEENMFLQLHKYNLLYINIKGIITLTNRGKKALKGDVEKFIQIERFEEQLLKESWRAQKVNRWIFLITVPALVRLAIILAFIILV